jgi:hypothetical protein
MSYFFKHTKLLILDNSNKTSFQRKHALIENRCGHLVGKANTHENTPNKIEGIQSFVVAENGMYMFLDNIIRKKKRFLNTK